MAGMTLLIVAFIIATAIVSFWRELLMILVIGGIAGILVIAHLMLTGLGM